MVSLMLHTLKHCLLTLQNNQILIYRAKNTKIFLHIFFVICAKSCAKSQNTA